MKNKERQKIPTSAKQKTNQQGKAVKWLQIGGEQADLAAKYDVGFWISFWKRKTNISGKSGELQIRQLI